ncbi:MAG: hypothetical protein ACRDUY_12990 [Nitriliruptorales bacterium]
MGPPTVLAHGLSVQGEVPVPIWWVAIAAAAVLVLSFLILGRTWQESRLEDGGWGRRLSRRIDRTLGGLEWPARVLGVVIAVTVWAAALFGPLFAIENVAPFAVYIAFWVGGIIVSAVVGDVWAVLSPFETAVRLVNRGRTVDRTPVPELGLWPAAVLLFGFAWLELVHPSATDPRTIGIAITVYAMVIAVGATWWGQSWVWSAEAFGALFRLLAAMAPLHRDDEGRLRLRPPFVGLARVPPDRGTAALVIVALGTTTFDGVTRLPFWTELAARRTGWAMVPIATLVMLAVVLVMGGIFLAAIGYAARRTDRPADRLAEDFAHSLVPIVFAYAVAHYFSLLVLEGQRTYILGSDPFGRGWDLFGTASWMVSYEIVSTALIGAIQVAAIVVGHLAGVVLAHDRAVALLEPKLAVASQRRLLDAMVAYTVSGLVLLLG